MGRLRHGPIAVALAVAFLVGCTFPSTTTNPPPREVPSESAVSSPRGPDSTGAPVSPDETLAPGQTIAPGQTSAATPAPVPGGAWQPLTDFPAGGAFHVTSVVAVPDGFVAVGYQALPGENFFGRHQGIVWRSPDGVTWQQTIELAFQFVTPIRILAIADALYVVGELSTCAQFTEEECQDVSEAGTALWRSVAGAPWERLPPSPSMQTGLVDGLVATDSGLVAFGGTGEEGASGTVWYSADGTTWSETNDLAGMDAISALVQGPQGVVAFGTRFNEELDNIELIGASSTDLAHFTPFALSAAQGVSIEDLARSDSGLVGIGYGESLEGELAGFGLSSADGITWAPATNPDGTFAGNGIERVHTIPGGYVALGFKPRFEDFGTVEGQAWFSADGQSWNAFGPMAGTFSVLDGSAVGPAGMVLFTANQEELDEDLTSTVSAWFAPASALTAH